MSSFEAFQKFSDDFPDIQVTINELGNLSCNPRETERRVLLQSVWAGWDEQTSTATDLHFGLVERNGKKYGEYNLDPFTGDLKKIVSFTGQPSLGETIALAQYGVSAVQMYRELPHDIQYRASGIVTDKSDSHTLKERLESSDMPSDLPGLTEMSPSERFLFFQAMLGDLALRL